MPAHIAYRRHGARAARVAVLGAFVIGLIAVLVPLGMGWLTLWAVTHPLCAPGPEPASIGLEAAPVTFVTRAGDERRGYHFQGTNGASIIVPPALGADRGGLLHEVAILVENGFSVLTYDSRPCAGPAAHSLGPWEADDIIDAVTYLMQRPDVDSLRIGVHGFSQAGASALLAAAQEPAIRAVSAEGGYMDYLVQTLGHEAEQGWFMRLFTVGARLGYRMATGASIAQLRLWDAIPKIAPRRVLLVYGHLEFTLAGARQAAMLGEHVNLWEVPGAMHGTYLESAGPSAFEEHVVSFFVEALAPTLP